MKDIHYNMYTYKLFQQGYLSMAIHYKDVLLWDMIRMYDKNVWVSKGHDQNVCYKNVFLWQGYVKNVSDYKDMFVRNMTRMYGYKVMFVRNITRMYGY